MSELSLEVPAADTNLRGVTVWRDTLQAPDAGDAAADWLTRFLGRPTRLVHIPEARARSIPATPNRGRRCISPTVSRCC